VIVSSLSRRWVNTSFFAIIQHIHRLHQQFVALLQLVLSLVRTGLIGVLVLQPVLPLHGAFALGPDRGVERRVRPGHALVHADDLGLGHAQIGGDLLDRLGAHVAILQRADPRLGLAQVEEQLLLRAGRAQLHQAPGPQDVFLNAGAIHHIA